MYEDAGFLRTKDAPLDTEASESFRLDGFGSPTLDYKGFSENQKSYFKTIRSCYSFTVEEMYEMWFMNLANSYLLENIYLPIKNYMNISDFMKLCYSIISQLDEFKLIQDEIIDIFNPSTAPRSIRKLQGQFRTIAVVKLLENNKLIINSEILQIALRDKVA